MNIVFDVFSFNFIIRHLNSSTSESYYGINICVCEQHLCWQDKELTEAKLNEDTWKEKETKYKKEKTAYEARINKLKRYTQDAILQFFIWEMSV